MSAKLIVYGTLLSPPVRAVLLTLKALNLDYEYKVVNIFSKDQYLPEFLEKNPQHTVPLLDDNGKYISDSHAIIAYLVNKYGKDDSLYPKEPYQRAIVDQRLHYDNGVLFHCFIKPTLPFIVRKAISKFQLAEKLKLVQTNYDLMETFLGDNFYIASKDLTIADFSIVSSISSINYMVPLEATRNPKLAAWYERITSLPYYNEAVGSGVKDSITMYELNYPALE